MSNQPIYQPMLDEIRHAVESGVYAPGQKLGTELEWSRKTGLSRVSVRRAVDLLVNDGVIQRQAGKGLYVPETPTWTRQIQLVVPGLTLHHHQWVRVASGCRSICGQHQVGLQIYDAGESLEQDIKHIQQLPQSHMDGAIIGSLAHPRFMDAIYSLKNSGMPFVMVDDALDQLGITSIMVDYYQGGYQAGEKLIEQGHERIGFVGRFSPRTISLMAQGLRDAIADAGLPLDRSLLLDLEVEDPLDDWRPAIDRCTRVLMNRKSPPTAIFYCNDDVAGYGYQTLKKMGLKIPDDVSVVGFGKMPVSQWLEPALTTIDHPCEEIGRRAAQLLINTMDSHGDEQAQQILLTPIWQNGASVQPCQKLHNS